MGQVVDLYLSADQVSTLIAYNILAREVEKDQEIDCIRISESNIKKVANRTKWHQSLEEEVRKSLLQNWGWHLLPKSDGYFPLLRASKTASFSRIDSHRVVADAQAIAAGNQTSLRAMKKLLKRDISNKKSA